MIYEGEKHGYQKNNGCCGGFSNALHGSLMQLRGKEKQQ